LTQASHGKAFAVLASRTAKKPLPSMALLCDLCRAASHGKAFTVDIGHFTVQIVARQNLIFP
jgi:hypothetical protein